MLAEPAKSWCKGNGPKKAGEEARQKVLKQGGTPEQADQAAAAAEAAADKGPLARFSPANAIGETAKAFAQAGVGYLQKIGQVIQATTRYTPGAEWFRSQYALSFGLALFLMVFVLLWTVGRATRAGADREEAFKAVFAYFPLALLLATFGPAVAYWLAGAIDELAQTGRPRRPAPTRRRSWSRPPKPSATSTPAICSAGSGRCCWSGSGPRWPGSWCSSS